MALASCQQVTGVSWVLRNRNVFYVNTRSSACHVGVPLKHFDTSLVSLRREYHPYLNDSSKYHSSLSDRIMPSMPAKSYDTSKMTIMQSQCIMENLREDMVSTISVIRIHSLCSDSEPMCAFCTLAVYFPKLLKELLFKLLCVFCKEDESTLILVRHGESMWNEKNLFTGCVDVPLTKKGVEEAIEAGKRISTMPIDIIYTSTLVRSQMTAMLALTQHCCQKVPIIMHNENEEARIWSQIYSEDTKNESIPVVKAWQLNERMYGDLQGLNKQETAEIFGKEQVHKWRRSYEVRPPNGESLEMCLQRAVAFFKENIEPQLMDRKHVMVVAHANSLRSIIMYLDNLTAQEVINLELSTGVPMLYIYRDGEFIRRGSPAGPNEAGVYACTWNLALYKEKYEEMLK